MKQMKFAAFSLLATIALTFSSCLGGTDSANQLVGTATVTDEFNNTVTFDDGVKATITNLQATYFMSAGFKRMQLVVTVTDEAYKKGNIPAGTKVNGTYSYINPLYDIQQTDSASLKTSAVTNFDNFTWAAASGIPYAYGNGYMNFVFTTTVLAKKATSSSTQPTLVTPRIYAAVQYNEKNKNVEVYIGADNRYAEGDADNDGKLDDGYSSYTNQPIYSTLNVQSLYNQLIAGGYSDTSNVNFTFYKVYTDRSNNKNTVNIEPLSMSQSSVQVGLLKRYY